MYGKPQTKWLGGGGCCAFKLCDATHSAQLFPDFADLLCAVSSVTFATSTPPPCHHIWLTWWRNAFVVVSVVLPSIRIRTHLQQSFSHTSKYLWSDHLTYKYDITSEIFKTAYIFLNLELRLNSPSLTLQFKSYTSVPCVFFGGKRSLVLDNWKTIYLSYL